MIDSLSSFKFQPEWDFLRKPARLAELQVLDFEKNYDYDTLWNDVIQITPNMILIIGPPLYDVALWMKLSCQFTDEHGNQLEWSWEEMDRVCRIRLTTNTYHDFIIFKTPFGEYQVPINLCRDEFRGKKVIVTISQNHPIAWLQQWIDYHK